MSGERLLLDTNAVITLLQGEMQLVYLLRQAEWIGISIISRIEFLVFPGLAEADRQLFQQFLQRVDTVGLAVDDAALIERVIVVRRQYRLKLPDAVIAAMAIQKDAALVTADREFTKVVELPVINWT